MHNSTLVKRNFAAHTRILTLASALATTLKIDPEKVDALTPKAKDKDVRLLMQREATANLLGDIALALGVEVPPIGEAEPVADGVQFPVGDDDQSPADGDEQVPVDDGADPATEAKASSDELPEPVIEE